MLFEVVDEVSLEDPGLQRQQRTLVARGGQMRVAAVPFRTHIYNRELALLPLDFDDNTAGAIAAREPGLLVALVALHARLWRQGRRWGSQFSGVRAADVDLADVLAHLLDGQTDEAAALDLHISLRTYRRRVQDLLRLLGTQSRFQAGAVAEARHYLDLVKPQTWPEPATPDAVADAFSGIRSLPG